MWLHVSPILQSVAFAALCALRRDIAAVISTEGIDAEITYMQSLLSPTIGYWHQDVPQGTKDAVYSVANAQYEIKMFKNSPDAQLIVVEGGAHFLSASHPKEVDEALIAFVTKYK